MPPPPPPPKTFFEKTWQFSSGDPTAYPTTGMLKITSASSTTCKVEWDDGLTPKQHHDFTLTYDPGPGKLSDNPAVDNGTATHLSWDFTISKNAAGGITGEVAGPEIPEANLAGTWGADAPPPACDDLTSSLPARSPEPSAAHPSL